MPSIEGSFLFTLIAEIRAAFVCFARTRNRAKHKVDQESQRAEHEREKENRRGQERTEAPLLGVEKNPAADEEIKGQEVIPGYGGALGRAE